MTEEIKSKVKYCPQCGSKIKSKVVGFAHHAYCEKCNIEWEIVAWYVHRNEKLAQAIQKFFGKYLGGSNNEG